MEKSLDRKLAAIHADPAGAKDFILADAKDADMAFGVASPGRTRCAAPAADFSNRASALGKPADAPPAMRLRSLAEFRDQMREIVRQGLVDIMLMSSSSSYELTVRERLFEGSPVTPAARANDTTDVWAVRNGAYLGEASRPFRSASIDHIQGGRLDCAPAERRAGADLGLYSITLNNRLAEDLATLAAYGSFREEAERKGFRHFLEVFDPNSPENLAPEEIADFVNDSIARVLAGVAGPGRPLFLKTAYHGPRAMEELVTYDPQLVVGILGGAAGTTYDAFKLLAEARRHGARAALFGRKINTAECQLTFVEHLRRIADDQLSPEEAVRSYHDALVKRRIPPTRALADDMELTSNVMRYAR